MRLKFLEYTTKLSKLYLYQLVKDLLFFLLDFYI